MKYGKVVLSESFLLTNRIQWMREIRVSVEETPADCEDALTFIRFVESGMERLPTDTNSHIGDAEKLPKSVAAEFQIGKPRSINCKFGVKFASRSGN